MNSCSQADRNAIYRKQGTCVWNRVSALLIRTGNGSQFFAVSHMRAFRNLIVLDLKGSNGNGRIIIVGVDRTDRGNGSGRRA